MTTSVHVGAKVEITRLGLALFPFVFSFNLVSGPTQEGSERKEEPGVVVLPEMPATWLTPSFSELSGELTAFAWASKSTRPFSTHSQSDRWSPWNSG